MSAPELAAREAGLRKQLSAGQMAMVAVGGSIGTGLLLGSGAAVRLAGPAVILSFVVAGLITWTVTVALAELATAHPAAGSFGVYAEIYLNPWAGFIARYGFWAAIAIAIGADMVASATYMDYWFPQVHPIVWVGTFAVGLLAINLRRVGDYGRFEYWFAMIKVVTIVVFILVGATLLLDGRATAQYRAHGGFLPNGILGPAIATSIALFTFAGIEFAAISSGESRSVKEISRAILISFVLLGFVYIGAIVVLVGVMPWNGAGTSESPFVSVFRVAGLPAASYVMNFVVLSAALSSANASLYADSRILFSLARGGYAPRQLGKLTKAGAPLPALLVSCIGIGLAFAMERWAPKSAFVNLLGAAVFGLLLAWMVVLAAHICFRRRLHAGEATAVAQWGGGTWMSAAGFAGMVAAVVLTWWSSPVTVLSAPIYLVALTVLYWLVKPAAEPKRSAATGR